MATSNITAPDVVTYTPPGISWTAPEKSRPWQQPPQYTDIMDVANSYIIAFSAENVMDDMLDALETKVPISVIAQSIMLTGVSEGRHTMDAGILVMPVIMEMLLSIAMLNDIKTVMYPNDYDRESTVSNRTARLAVEKAMKKIEVAAEPAKEEKPVSGLMARKQKEVV
jgi:hypothetical protein